MREDYKITMAGVKNVKFVLTAHLRCVLLISYLEKGTECKTKTHTNQILPIINI